METQVHRNWQFYTTYILMIEIIMKCHSFSAHGWKHTKVGGTLLSTSHSSIQDCWHL